METYINKGGESMSNAAKEAMELMEILPESEQNFALEMLKKIVIAWDPDFTKLTPLERKSLEEAEEELKNGDFVSEDEINWD